MQQIINDFFLDILGESSVERAIGTGKPFPDDIPGLNRGDSL